MQEARRKQLAAEVLRLADALEWKGVIEVRLLPNRTPQILTVHRTLEVEARPF